MRRRCFPPLPAKPATLHELLLIEQGGRCGCGASLGLALIDDAGVIELMCALCRRARAPRLGEERKAGGNALRAVRGYRSRHAEPRRRGRP